LHTSPPCSSRLGLFLRPKRKRTKVFQRLDLAEKL
jgi:hypothetical protein